MSRNSSGTYSLPTGNPVVTQTPISSTTHNATMADLATEMTDSLSRSGDGPMLAPLELVNGTVSAPAVTFDSDTNTGLYRAGADNPAMAAGGVQTQTWSASSFGSTFPLGLRITQSQGLAGLFVTGGSGNPAITATVVGDATALQATGGGDGNGARLTGAGLGSGAQCEGGATGVGATCLGNANRGPIRLSPLATAPATPEEGELYYDSATHKLYVCTNAGWKLITSA